MSGSFGLSEFQDMLQIGDAGFFSMKKHIDDPYSRFIRKSFEDLAAVLKTKIFKPHKRDIDQWAHKYSCYSMKSFFFTTFVSTPNLSNVKVIIHPKDTL